MNLQTRTCFQQMPRPDHSRIGGSQLASKKIPLIDRLESVIDRTGPDWNGKGPCWNWRLHRDKAGYGRVWADGKMRKAHRVVYELFSPKIPDGLVIDHLCRNPRCVNPDHLEPVTSGENTRRGILKGTKKPLTHCKRGHEFTLDNTDFNRDGYRLCRKCKLASKMAHHWRKKALDPYYRYKVRPDQRISAPKEDVNGNS
jgi:hypothetical protein